MLRNNMHQPMVRIPCPTFHTLPTLNRTSFGILQISDFETHCIRRKHIALRFCLGDQALRLCVYRGIVTETVQPANIGLTTEPGELTLGIIAVPLAGGGDGLLKGEAAGKIFGRLALA
jgi:hypothetical protein